ncbi:MAG: outer membrane lipoprotein-sorting protein [Treponema sp.]|nr:outer membrane lipoprotein-sorting protein [Treponema sp.]
MKRILMIIAVVAAALAGATGAFAATTDFKAILRNIDSMQDFGKQDYSAVYNIVSEKPDENPSTTQVKIFRRDQHNQIVILLQKPDKQKGQGYLKIDDNVWFYDPESGNFSHSTMKENINNTDAKSSDFKRYTFADDYTITQSGEGKLGAYDVWILTLEAKNNEVSYQKVRLTIRKDKPLPLKEEDFSVSDRLMRTILFLPTYVEAGGKLIPAKIKMIDEISKGNQSVLTISDVAIGKLPDSTFSKSFLERVQ